MKTYTIYQSQQDVLEKISDGQVITVQLGEMKVYVKRVGLSFFAFERYCPHSGADLKKAHIHEGRELTCPMHGYCYDMVNGREVRGRSRSLKVFRAILSENGLEIFGSY